MLLFALIAVIMIHRRGRSLRGNKKERDIPALEMEMAGDNQNDNESENGESEREHKTSGGSSA